MITGRSRAGSHHAGFKERTRRGERALRRGRFVARTGIVIALGFGSTGCLGHSIGGEVDDYHELVRRTSASVRILRSAAATEHRRTWLRENLDRIGTEAIVTFRDPGCDDPAPDWRVVQAERLLEATDGCRTVECIEQTALASELDRSLSGPRRVRAAKRILTAAAACTTIGCLEQLGILLPIRDAGGSPLDEAGQRELVATRIAAALECGDTACLDATGVFDSTRRDPDPCDLVADPDGDGPAPKRFERSPLVGALDPALPGLDGVGRFATSLRAISRGESAAEINSALRGVSFPTKVAVSSLQDEPSRELSQVDGVTGILMEMFSSVLELQRNRKLLDLLKDASSGIAAAGNLASWRVAIVQAEMRTRLRTRVAEAQTALAVVIADVCVGGRAGSCSDGDSDREEKLFEAYDRLAAAREALGLLDTIDLDESLAHLGASTRHLREIARNPDGPNAFSKEAFSDYQRHRVALRDRRARAVQTYEALVRLDQLLSESPTHKLWSP